MLLAGVVYYFVRPEPLPTPEVPKQANSDAATNMSFEGSNIVEEKDGKRVWELTAVTIQVDANTKDVQLSDLKGVFYRENGGKIDITAKQGRIDNKTHDIYLDGDVHAVSNDGAVFTAAKSKWAETERHFYGSGGIKITRDDTVITGDTINTDEKMEHIKVEGNAHIVKGGVTQ
jgi:LPS export ABC transporter protein LptC